MKTIMHGTNLMGEVVSNKTLDAAFDAMYSHIYQDLNRCEIPENCACVRYMDDGVILTKTRSALRRMVKKMQTVIQKLTFKLAKDKTFIGKISRGFDFWGIASTTKALSVWPQRRYKISLNILLCFMSKRLITYVFSNM